MKLILATLVLGSAAMAQQPQQSQQQFQPYPVGRQMLVPVQPYQRYQNYAVSPPQYVPMGTGYGRPYPYRYPCYRRPYGYGGFGIGFGVRW